MKTAQKQQVNKAETDAVCVACASRQAVCASEQTEEQAEYKGRVLQALEGFFGQKKQAKDKKSGKARLSVQKQGKLSD